MYNMYSCTQKAHLACNFRHVLENKTLLRDTRHTQSITLTVNAVGLLHLQCLGNMEYECLSRLVGGIAKRSTFSDLI